MADMTADVARDKTRSLPTMSEATFAWMLIVPAVVFIFVIVAWPLAETVRLSFMEATLGGER